MGWLEGKRRIVFFGILVTIPTNLVEDWIFFRAVE